MLLDGEARDWCAVQAVGQDASGADAYRVCRRLSTSSAIDWCLDAAARAPDPPAPSNLCGSIKSDELRPSCWIEVADRLTRTDEPIETLVDACRDTGDLLRFCVYHIPVGRIDYYKSHGGIDALIEEMGSVARLFPEALETGDLGVGAAKTGALLSRMEALEVCQAFPQSRARTSCEQELASN
jgi:hypothetical protein